MSDSPFHKHNKAVIYRRGLHVVAILTACAVFPLIFVGAGVTSKDAGMAYPNGFNSDGYFLRNPPGWFNRDDTRWEHGHRLLGRAVGLSAIVLAIWCWPGGGTVRILGVCNLLAITVQGVLGALRVNEVSTTLAMVHGILGQMCFCLACCVALITGRTWRQASGASNARHAGFPQRRPPLLKSKVKSPGSKVTQLMDLRLSTLDLRHSPQESRPPQDSRSPQEWVCLLGTAGAMIQLVSGAALRHFGFGAALLAHVFGAIAATFLLGWTAMWVIGRHPRRHLLTWLGSAMVVLLVLQLLLGGFTFTVTVMGGRWSPFFQWAVPSAHVATGALLLVCSVLVTLSTYHLLRPVSQPEGPAATAPVTMA